MPRSEMGRVISGTLAFASASRTSSTVGEGMSLMVRATEMGWSLGGWLCRLVQLGLLIGPRLDRLQELAQLTAAEVAGGDLAQAEAQTGDFAGEELHIGV